jgi:ATP-dependent Clp protease adaptor protein ClpS
MKEHPVSATSLFGLFESRFPSRRRASASLRENNPFPIHAHPRCSVARGPMWRGVPKFLANSRRDFKIGPREIMPQLIEPGTVANPTIVEETRSINDLAPGYLVICWNDPVNLMDYVTHVFMKVFGLKKAKARKHMLEVHEKGKSVLVRENSEKAEFYVHQLQNYQLHATMEPAE